MTYTKKYGKGWFNESERHRLSRLGIKTGRKNYARELRDELEVPGHVMAYEVVNKKQVIKELNDIMDKWEKQGYKTPNAVPESKEKQRYRELLRKLGLKVSFSKKKIIGEGPWLPYKVSYSKIDYSLMSKLQSFIHKNFSIAVTKHPKHIQRHPDIVKARHDIEKVTNFDKFKAWVIKHKNAIVLIGLGGLIGAVTASGQGTMMQNIHTGEIVAVGRTVVGRFGLIGQTVLTGMGVFEEAKIISKDTHKKLLEQTLISPEELKVQQKVIVFKVKPTSYSKYSKYFPEEDDSDDVDLKDISSPSIPYSQLTEKEKKVLNTSISKVKDVLGKRGKSIRFNEKNLQIVKRVGPDDTAFGAHQGDLIQIDRDTLKDPDKTEGVLLHESIHKLYGVRDETRELENLHIDYLGELM